MAKKLKVPTIMQARDPNGKKGLKPATQAHYPRQLSEGGVALRKQFTHDSVDNEQVQNAFISLPVQKGGVALRNIHFCIAER